MLHMYFWILWVWGVLIAPGLEISGFMAQLPLFLCVFSWVRKVPSLHLCFPIYKMGSLSPFKPGWEDSVWACV